MHESVKLTLRLDKELISFAKHYSEEHGKSVSQMVAEYFALLANRGTSAKTLRNTPITHSLRGVLGKAKVSAKDYKKYLEEKYL